MLIETPHPTLLSGRSRRAGGWLRALLRPFSAGQGGPTVVFCYDLQNGESLLDWCRRHPERIPPADTDRVCWVVPEAHPLAASWSTAGSGIFPGAC